MLTACERWLGLVLERPGGRRIAVLAVLAVIALMLFARLGAAPVERNSELRCHEVAKEMVRSGDWLVPRFEGLIRLQKPPLYYWLASASAVATGGEVTLGTTRFPSAVAALLLAVLVFFWGCSARDGAFGLLAVMILAAMMQFSTSGRRGDAEMTLALCCTASLFAFDRWWESRATRYLLLFAGALTLAFLAKATVVFVTVLLPIVVFVLIERRGRELRSPRFWFAVLAAAVAGFAWYGVLAIKVPGALDVLLGDAVLPVGIETGSASGAEHFMGPLYFLSKVWVIAFPASLLLPAAGWWWWRTGIERDEPRRRFTTIAFLAMFVTFSILPQKQKHYLLPALPVLALTLADVVLGWAATAPQGFRRFVRGTGVSLAMIGLVGVAAFEMLLVNFEPERVVARFVLLPFIGLALLVAAIAALRALPKTFFAAFFLGFIGLVVDYQAHFKVASVEIDAAVMDHRPVPDEDHLLAVANEKPWLARLLIDDDDLKKIKKRRAAESAPPDPESKPR